MTTSSDRQDDLATAVKRAREMARRGDLQAAIDRLQALAERSSDPAPAIFEIGNLTKAAGLYDEAEAAFRTVMKTYPGSIEAATNLANVLAAKGDTQTAIAILGNVRRAAPDNPTVEISLANALFVADRLEEALAAYDGLTARHPGFASVHANRGEALARLGRHREAVAALDKAATLEPANPNIRRNRAFSRLTLGEFSAGFADYEARLDPGVESSPVRLNLTAPRWNGTASPDGPLLVVAEQGLGDEIRFAAAIPALLETVGEVVLECDPRLVELLSASLSDAHVIAFQRRRDGQRPVFDYARLPVRPAAWIEAGSLPHRLGLPHQEAISPGGYLTPDPMRTAALREQLTSDAQGRPLIGFCWGSAAADASRQRYYPPLAAWRPIFEGLNAAFVDLQYIPSEADRTAFRSSTGVEILATDALDKRNDLSGAAALAAAMDAVLGVSSSVTAMAAAVGTPTVEVTPERTWVPTVNGKDAWLGPLLAAYPDRPGNWAQGMQRALEALKSILGPAVR